MALFPDDISASLDLKVVLKKLSTFCATHEGKAECLRVSPLASKALILSELYCVKEVLDLYINHQLFPSTEFEPILANAQKLGTKNVNLEEQAFAGFRFTVSNYYQLHKYVADKSDTLLELNKSLSDLKPQTEIIKLVDRVLDDRARVLSSASKELGQIRDQLKRARTDAAIKFERALKKHREADYIAEFNETVSDNRRVIAVKAAFKNKVRGIVHGSSGKRNVVFIEPGETVEVNNLIVNLIDDERQEITRILRELATSLAPFQHDLISTHVKMLWLDILNAKAKYARKISAALPAITSNEIELVEAYNPALKILNDEKGKPTIPLNINLNSKGRILIISGPNAGGKTIAMKTLGLCSLMLQSGLLIPVHPNSKIRLFENLFADIGDSQSIENELSTYSSKLAKMKHFLDFADENTLLLIDEFGSGSDPELGSSLAGVFLERLNSYGCWGIFTTHYNSIKAQAAELDGTVNGAMLFDQVNLNPTFKLEIGNPGSSYTFEVAEQSGISKHIISAARQSTAETTLHVDKLLNDLQRDKQKLEQNKTRLSKELDKLRSLNEEREFVMQKLEDKLDKQSKLNVQTDRILKWGQKFEKLVQSWNTKNSKKDKKEIVARFIAILNQGATEARKEAIKKERTQSKGESAKLKKALATKIEVGDQIKVIDTGLKAQVISIKNGKYTVSIGQNIRSILTREQFIPFSTPIRPREKQKRVPKKKDQKPKS